MDASQISEQYETPTTNIYDIMTKSDEQLAEDFRRMDTGHGNNDREKLVPTPEHNEVSTENSSPVEDGINSEGRKSLYQRMFSKMEAGSLRGSIFAMSSLALGTGCLALPQKFEQMSFVAGVVLLFLGALASYWSLTLLIKASTKTKIYNYSRLVKEVWGKWPALFLDINILLYILGILISYQCISNIIF
jgi:hypothetical protein